jgi:hypothetical protein
MRAPSSANRQEAWSATECYCQVTVISKNIDLNVKGIGIT